MRVAAIGLSVIALAGSGQTGGEYVKRYDKNADNVLSIEELPISDEDREKIFEGNAKRLLKLS